MYAHNSPSLLRPVLWSTLQSSNINSHENVLVTCVRLMAAFYALIFFFPPPRFILKIWNFLLFKHHKAGKHLYVGDCWLKLAGCQTCFMSGESWLETFSHKGVLTYTDFTQLCLCRPTRVKNVYCNLNTTQIFMQISVWCSVHFSSVLVHLDWHIMQNIKNCNGTKKIMNDLTVVVAQRNAFFSF